MSNLAFKNPFEMSHDELLAYVADLEKRIANANNGAAIFRGEANLNRVEMLKYKEIADQHYRDLLALVDVAQRKVSGLSYLLEGASAVCHSWTEYETVNRMLLHHVEGICHWLNRQVQPDAPVDAPAPDMDDIPF